jgi:hypothetical protein
MRLLAQLHDTACHADQGVARLGQFDAPSLAQEKLHSVALLQFLYLRRHRRLADIQRFRRLGEAPAFGHRVKGPKVGKSHCHRQWIGWFK